VQCFADPERGILLGGVHGIVESLFRRYTREVRPLAASPPGCHCRPAYCRRPGPDAAFADCGCCGSPSSHSPHPHLVLLLSWKGHSVLLLSWKGNTGAAALAPGHEQGGCVQEHGGVHHRPHHQDHLHQGHQGRGSHSSTSHSTSSLLNLSRGWSLKPHQASTSQLNTRRLLQRHLPTKSAHVKHKSGRLWLVKTAYIELKSGRV